MYLLNFSIVIIGYTISYDTILQCIQSEMLPITLYLYLFNSFKLLYLFFHIISSWIYFYYFLSLNLTFLLFILSFLSWFALYFSLYILVETQQLEYIENIPIILERNIYQLFHY